MTVFRSIAQGLSPWWSWALARRLLAGIAVLGAAAVVMAEAVSASPLHVVAVFDGPIMLSVEASRSDWLSPILILLTRMASYEFMAGLFGVLIFWAGLKRGHWELVVVPAVAAGGAFALSVLIKTTVWRARPDVLVHPLADMFGPSFPSGHAMRGVALYIAFAWLFTRRASAPVKLIAYAAALLIAGIAGYGRIYLGAHWPTDVLAGAVVSLAWTVYSLSLLQRYCGHLLSGAPALGRAPARLAVGERVVDDS